MRRGNEKKHGIDEDDFVYVDGLRLYDSDGLHYLTGRRPVSIPTMVINTDIEIRHQLLGVYEPSS